VPQNQLPRPVTTAFILAGVALIAAFFAPWIGVAGESVSGWFIASEVKTWLFVIPLSGALLALAAASGSRYTRLIAVAAGLAVTGDIVVNVLDGVLHGGADTWLLLGGAGAILAGIADQRRSLRAIGGLAVLLGFFAPWSDSSMFAALTDDGLGGDLIDALGVSFRVLWAIPAAGVLAIGAGFVGKPIGRKLAAGAGIAVYAAFVWAIGSLANVFLAWGAWTTLVASTLALVLGLLAPGRSNPAAR
jgi:hypothetical protein